MSEVGWDLDEPTLIMRPLSPIPLDIMMEDSKTGKELVWDDDYNDPRAEIIMLSNDHVGFRAHVWKLQEASAFIADLIEVAEFNNTETTPIHLDYNAIAIRTFLDLINAHDRQKLKFDHLSWNACLSVINLCDYLSAPTIDKMFLYELCTARIAKNHSSELFRFANMRNDVDLARIIIPIFNMQDGYDMFVQMEHRGMEGIRSAWLLELLKHRFRWLAEGGPVKDWVEIAEHFNPGRSG